MGINNLDTTREVFILDSRFNLDNQAILEKYVRPDPFVTFASSGFFCRDIGERFASPYRGIAYQCRLLTGNVPGTNVTEPMRILRFMPQFGAMIMIVL
jgi:hypothetical protein